MYDTATGRAVRAGLEELVHGTAGAHEESRAKLRARIWAAVDELKANGWSVEKIIIRLKELADEVGFAQRFDLQGRDRQSIMGQIVQWCVERYYGPRP
jgi:hypothetical protein